MADQFAFPCTVKVNTSSDPLATPRPVEHPGMTLRDWFAGQALNGFLSGRGVMPDKIITAQFAYRFADAMLAERERGK